MPGATAILALAASVVAPAVAGAYVDPFSIQDPDVYFNLTLPPVSPFFRYNGKWSDGGMAGPTTLYAGANASFYGAGTGAFIYAHTNVTGAQQQQQQQQPASMLANYRRNGTSLGDGKWEYSYNEPHMLYMFALVDGVSASQPLMLDSVTIQTGMYTEASSFDQVYCKTEAFTQNASLPLKFQGSWDFNVGPPQAWGGSVVADLPLNTSYVWINASTVTTASESNTMTIFMTQGTTPLNYIQISLNSRRSYEQDDMIVYQAPLDPTDKYELTLSAPSNNLIRLSSITYCSYYIDGKIPAAKRSGRKALIGGLVGGLVGGIFVLGILAFVLWRCVKRRREPEMYDEIHPLEVDTRAPDAFVPDESAAAVPFSSFPKRDLGSVSGIPRSSSPMPMNGDSYEPTLEPTLEHETKRAILAQGSGDNTISGDRTMSADSQMSAATGTTERQNSKDSEARLPRRPRRPRRTRHVVEHAEDGGEVRVENGEELVVEVLPPQYQPEWDQRRDRTT